MKRLMIAVAALAICHGNLVPTFGGTLGPTPYLSLNDSPFPAIDFSPGYFYLEDCEDGQFDEPGVTVNAGQITDRGSSNDSVDGDDGLIDGVGRTLSFWSGNGVQNLIFNFDAGVLGSLPTHVGIVWTDVGWSQPTVGYGDVVFEAYDAHGSMVGTILADNLGDGLWSGQTSEDRFFGAFHEGGIAEIRISMPNTDPFINWEVDHLQYGMVPEPSTVVLLIGGMLTLGVYGRRRRCTGISKPRR